MNAARIEWALTGTGTALLLGGVIIVSVLAYIAGERGMMRPEAWVYGLAAGLGVLVLKVVGELLERGEEAGLWRDVLTAEFGPDMRQDAEVSRLARQVIEFRVRLADAHAKAEAAERRRIAPNLSGLDVWIDGIVRLAREVSALRAEASFQSGLATRARSRRKEVQGQATGSTDHELARQMERTVEGLGAQIATAEDVSRFVESGLLKLEQSVAAFGAACSQLVLALKRGFGTDGVTDIGTKMADEIGVIERQIAMIENVAVQLALPESRPKPDSDPAISSTAVS
jgi:hypothetical protein